MLLVTRNAVLKKVERPAQIVLVGWTEAGRPYMREHVACHFFPRTLLLRTDTGGRALLYDFGAPVPSGAVELAPGVTVQPLLEADLPEHVRVAGLPIVAEASAWLRAQVEQREVTDAD